MNDSESVSDVEIIHEYIVKFLRQNAEFRGEVEARLADERARDLFGRIIQARQPLSCSHLGRQLGWTKSTVSRRVRSLSRVLQRVSEKYKLYPPLQLSARYKGQNRGVVIHCDFAALNEVQDNLEKLCRTAGYSSRGETIAVSSQVDIATDESVEPGSGVRESTTPDVLEEDSAYRVRQHLLREAMQGLLRQLRSRTPDAYVALQLQKGSMAEPIGKFPKLLHEDIIKSLLNAAYNWSSFDVERLLPPEGAYVISSVSGAGKTTFLRYLQWQIVKQTDYPAIYVSAKEMVRIAPFTSNELIKCLATKCAGEVPGAHFSNVFSDAFGQRKLILLIDELDGLREPEKNCPMMIGQLLNRIASNPVVIAVRPSAVGWMGDRHQLHLLRFKPLNRAGQKCLLGQYFEKAHSICAGNRRLLAVPLCAYLVKELARTGWKGKFRTRWELYSEVIQHIFYELPWNLPERRRDEWAENLKRSLGRIAYEALDMMEPVWEACVVAECGEMPEDATVVSHRPSDQTTGAFEEPKGGIRNLLSHSSFQDYFAAWWALRDDGRVHHVVDERWTGKWRGVVKFLADAQGGSFVKSLSFKLLFERLFDNISLRDAELSGWLLDSRFKAAHAITNLTE